MNPVSEAVRPALHVAIMKSPPEDQPILVRGNIIGQANQILTRTYGVDAGEAFALLSAASHVTGHTLWTTAERIVETGELPRFYQSSLDDD
jgi:AmiR/NasT family two-component response regulator